MGYKKEWYIRLDVKKQFDNDVMNLVSQNVYGNVFNIQLFDEGSAIDLTDVNYVGITILKSDGTNVVGSCEVVDELNGKVRYTVDIQAIAALGLTQATIELYSQDIKVSSTQFNFNVIADLYEGTDASVESTTEYPLLTELLADASNMNQKVLDLETQFNNAINGVTTDTEVIDSHVDTPRDTTYTTLKERLDKDSTDILAMQDNLDQLNIDSNLIELNAKNIYNIMLARKYEAKDTPLNGLFFDGFVDVSMFDSTTTVGYDNDNDLIDVVAKNQVIPSTNTITKNIGTIANIYQGLIFNSLVDCSAIDVSLSLRKYGGPSDSFVVEVYRKPTEFVQGDDLTTLELLGTQSILGTSLTTSYVEHNFNFNNLNLLKGDNLLILLSRTDALSDTHYYQVSAANEYLEQEYYSYKNTISTNANKILNSPDTYQPFIITVTYNNTSSKYQTTEQDMEQDINEVITYLSKKAMKRTEAINIGIGTNLVELKVGHGTVGTNQYSYIVQKIKTPIGKINKLQLNLPVKAGYTTGLYLHARVYDTGLNTELARTLLETSVEFSEIGASAYKNVTLNFEEDNIYNNLQPDTEYMIVIGTATTSSFPYRHNSYYLYMNKNTDNTYADGQLYVASADKTTIATSEITTSATDDLNNAIFYGFVDDANAVDVTPKIAVYDTTEAFEVMTKDSSYTPRYIGDGYIEEKYTYTVPTPITNKQNVKLQLEMKISDANDICEVKEYGVIIR